MIILKITGTIHLDLEIEHLILSLEVTTPKVAGLPGAIRI